MRALLKEKIKSLGYEVNNMEVIKNGEKKDAMVIRDGDVCPVFYYDELEKDYIEGAKIAEIAENIIKIVKEHARPEIGDVLSKEYVVNNITLGLVRHNDDTNYVTKESKYKDLDMYLQVTNKKEEAVYSTKVNKALIEHLGLDEQELWSIAEKNTAKDYIIGDMLDVLFGEGSDIADSDMIIITNQEKVNGAAVCLLDEVVNKIYELTNHKKWVMLPSSVHEVLLYKANETDELEPFNQMVKEVNATMESKDILGTHAYWFE